MVRAVDRRERLGALTSAMCWRGQTMRRRPSFGRLPATATEIGLLWRRSTSTTPTPLTPPLVRNTLGCLATRSPLARATAALVLPQFRVDTSRPLTEGLAMGKGESSRRSRSFRRASAQQPRALARQPWGTDGISVHDLRPKKRCLGRRSK